MSRLTLFFDQYIPGIDVPAMNLVDAFNGLQFLPLEKSAYLLVQSLVNQIETKFECV